MGDKPALKWLYQNSKPQLPLLLASVASQMLLAGSGSLLVLSARAAIDEGLTGGRDRLIARGMLLLLVIVLQLLLRTALQGRLEMGYKTKLLRAILGKDYTRIRLYHSGDLMNRLTSDIGVVSDGVATILPNLAGLTTRLLTALAVLAMLDGQFARVFMIVGPLLYLAARLMRARIKRLHTAMQAREGAVRSFLQEAVESILVVKTFGAEAAMAERAAALQQQHYLAKVSKNTVGVLANAGFAFLFSLGYLFALVWSASRLAAGTISFGTLTAILQLVGQVQTPFAGLSGLLPRVYSALASAERLSEIAQLPDESEINDRAMGTEGLAAAWESLELEGVSFCYDRDQVLSEVNLAIRRGDCVAVSGASGSGKSTLLLLLLGVLAPLSGAIRVRLQGGEMLTADKYTRRLFAYVPQGHLLLSGTIRENIALVKPEATDEEIMAAAQVGCIAEVIESLPAGLSTVIGERGQGLSEGQVQRLAVARAVLSGAPVLLLDEATSALDEATEARLLANLRVLGDRTCIIVSHRPAALSVSNREIHLAKEGVTCRTREGVPATVQTDTN